MHASVRGRSPVQYRREKTITSCRASQSVLVSNHSRLPPERQRDGRPQSCIFSHMLKLFHSPGACSLAPHVLLEEIGAPYEAVRVDLRTGQQRTPEYLRTNWKGKVPALA